MTASVDVAAAKDGRALASSEVCGTDRRKPKLGKVLSQRSSATPAGGSIASRSMSIANAGAFGQHRGGAGDAALADVLGGVGEAALGDLGQQLEVRAQPLARRVERRLPVVKRLAIGAAQIDRRDERVAGPRVEAGQKSLSCAAEDRDGELDAVGAQIGVAADDRHAVCRRRPPSCPRGSAAAASPSAQIASTTAIGRPPIAAMSETFTMTPHQPANQGSAATNSLMKPSIANSR